LLSINLSLFSKISLTTVQAGKDLESRTSTLDDLVQQYYLETIADIAHRLEKPFLEKNIKKAIWSGKTFEYESWIIAELADYRIKAASLLSIRNPGLQ
jgi:hypothetical protein